MVDPAVAYQPGQNYTAYDQGVESSVYLKNPGNTNFTEWFVSVVWPGEVVYPVRLHFRNPLESLGSSISLVLIRIGSTRTLRHIGLRNSQGFSTRTRALMWMV